MFENEEVGAIRTIMSGYDGPDGIKLPIAQMGTYLAVWYIFTITTYGVWVPAGLFLPGIIVGCAIGAIYEEVNLMIFSDENKSYSASVVPVLLAVGAMLSAYCRMTYSLAVIMMETTASINIFMPMFCAIMVSRLISNIFTPSLYQVTIKNKGIPILPKTCPAEARDIVLTDIMKTEVVCLTTICTVKEVRYALAHYHSGYPVKNTAGRLVGLIPTHMLVVLARNKIFYDKSLIDPAYNSNHNLSGHIEFGQMEEE